MNRRVVPSKVGRSRKCASAVLADSWLGISLGISL